MARTQRHRQRASVIGCSETSFHHMHLPIASLHQQHSSGQILVFRNAGKNALFSDVVMRNINTWLNWAETHNRPYYSHELITRLLENKGLMCVFTCSTCVLLLLLVWLGARWHRPKLTPPHTCLPCLPAAPPGHTHTHTHTHASSRQDQSRCSSASDMLLMTSCLREDE